MPTIRIHFPEKDHSQTVVLRGSRITIGRLPSNTIQITDRSVSARHAELVAEGDHYRLHDTDSTNGTFINGQRISEYHLHENCKISFGTMECEFDAIAGTEKADADTELLPTHADIEALRTENAGLKNHLETLKAELETLHRLKPREGGSESLVVSREEHEALADQLAVLKDTLFQREQEVKQLHEQLGIVKREQEVLEKALEVAKTTPEAATPAAVVTPAATPRATVAPSPAPAMPKAAVPATPSIAKAPEAAPEVAPKLAPLPSKPAVVPKPAFNPSTPAPALSVPVAKAPAPVAPAVPSVPAAEAPVQAPPPGAIGGPKPKVPSVPTARPAVSTPSAVPKAPAPAGFKAPVATAAPGMPKPALKPMAVAAKPAVATQSPGPGGTQKLEP